jgi:PleD family two-component response regulator
MSNRVPAIRSQPLVLLAGLGAEQTQDLSNALLRGGFRVVTAGDARQTVDVAQSHAPHAIILGTALAAPDYTLCLALRTLALATPIVVLGSGELQGSEQLAAFRAGAWDAISAPYDLTELLLRLELFVAPRLELDRVSEERLLDRESGLYTPGGLARRAIELAALATRHGLTLACAVFRPAEALPTRADDDRLAVALRQAGRASDALGRTGQAEFAVFAPASTTLVATRLMLRITDSIEHQLGFVAKHGTGIGIRSGCSMSYSLHHISPPALLARARTALELH